MLGSRNQGVRDGPLMVVIPHFRPQPAETGQAMHRLASESLDMKNVHDDADCGSVFARGWAGWNTFVVEAS